MKVGSFEFDRIYRIIPAKTTGKDVHTVRFSQVFSFEKECQIPVHANSS